MHTRMFPTKSKPFQGIALNLKVYAFPEASSVILWKSCSYLDFYQEPKSLEGPAEVVSEDLWQGLCSASRRVTETWHSWGRWHLLEPVGGSRGDSHLLQEGKCRYINMKISMKNSVSDSHVSVGDLTVGWLWPTTFQDMHLQEAGIESRVGDQIQALQYENASIPVGVLTAGSNACS